MPGAGCRPTVGGEEVGMFPEINIQLSGEMYLKMNIS